MKQNSSTACLCNCCLQILGRKRLFSSYQHIAFSITSVHASIQAYLLFTGPTLFLQKPGSEAGGGDEIKPASCSTADMMAVYHSHYLTESIKEAESCLRSSPGARWEQLGGQWRNVIYRDQRSLVLIWCSKFQPGSDRLAAGWCQAHMMAMNLWNWT